MDIREEDMLEKIISRTKPAHSMPFTGEPLYSQEQIKSIIDAHMKIVLKGITEDILRPPKEIIPIQYINTEKLKLHQYLRVAALLTKTTPEELMSKNRKKEYVYGRTIYYLLARMYTDNILDDIGLVVGTDHATVLYHINKVYNHKYRRPEIELFIRDNFRKDFSMKKMYYK